MIGAPDPGNVFAANDVENRVNLTEVTTVPTTDVGGLGMVTVTHSIINCLL